MHSRRVTLAALAAALLVVVFATPAAEDKILDCTYKGRQMFGKVKFVDSNPDVTIKPTCSFPDLKVKIVDSFADQCGEWEIVDSFPDFTVGFESSFPDLKVQFVDSFPGKP